MSDDKFIPSLLGLNFEQCPHCVYKDKYTYIEGLREVREDLEDEDEIQNVDIAMATAIQELMDLGYDLAEAQCNANYLAAQALWS